MDLVVHVCQASYKLGFRYRPSSIQIIDLETQSEIDRETETRADGDRPSDTGQAIRGDARASELDRFSSRAHREAPLQPTNIIKLPVLVDLLQYLCQMQLSTRVQCPGCGKYLHVIERSTVVLSKGSR